MNKLVVGYVRISVKDTGDSVGNQISLIKEYCSVHNLKLDDIYVDDGSSGINFERSAFLKLKSNIERGLISTLIVKDISRLGREAFLSSYYINEYFKQHNVLFITIDDEDINNEMLVNIRSIMNDSYVKDASLKRKSVAINKTFNHEYIGPYPPFGYDIVYSSGLRTLSINEFEANIVKDIFSLTVDGFDLDYIAIYLNNLFLNDLRDFRRKSTTYTWNSKKVRKVLENPVYKGDLVVRKSYKYNYKDKKRKYISPRDYQIIENVFPSIVNKECFLQVNDRLRKYKTHKKKRHESYLENKVICNKCGIYMKFYQRYKNDRREYYFKCPKCLKSILLNKLLMIIKENINCLLSDIDKPLVIDNLQKRFNLYVTEIQKRNTEDINTENLKLREVYIKKYNGFIDQESFKKIKDSIDNKKNILLRNNNIISNYKIQDINKLYENLTSNLNLEKVIRKVYINEKIIIKYCFHKKRTMN